MKKYLLFVFCLATVQLFAQEDSVVVIEEKKEETPATKVFYSQKLINTKTVEVLRRGMMEFSVGHNFGDIAGDQGGITRFFGLDATTDARIGFQIGLSDKVNVVAARAKGLGPVAQMWELGLKWQILRQQDGDPKKPFSMTLYANNVMSTQKRAVPDNLEHSFEDFGSRHSQFYQLMIARKMGKVSLQISPAVLHTNHVLPYDQKTIFALGGALRLPLTKKLVFIADYSHSFRSEATKDSFAVRGTDFYDPLGIGFEILTEGHIFSLNFTNALEILENHYIRRTQTSWGKGAFRWSFTLARNFVLFRSKKDRQSN